MIPGAAAGILTFLFTDVQGSTRLWEQHPAEMRSALADHDEILRANIAAAGGLVFSTAGDAFAAAFPAPDGAIVAASSSQRDLAGHGWPDPARIRVRMGIHTGVAHRRNDDYFGPTLNRAARLMSAAHGGQTVLSAATHQLLTDAPLRDMGEHRLKDLSRPEHVWQLLIEGLSQDFPPLRTLDAVPTNLPMGLASFVGREDEIERLMFDLEKNRLVVMTGVGGVGKTRLSLQVAADASHHYPQGLWLVELAPVHVEDGLPYQVLETLGLDAEPGRRPLQTVAAAIGNGSVLLVLDNCEHLLGAASDAVSELLGACPNLRVLASSRRALGIDGEQVRRVQPLATTGIDSASTQLFLDRATAAGQDGLSDRMDVISDICRRLDGVPLAIELAAARTRSMTPEDVAGRLDQRFRLLRGSRSSVNDRHQTLMSTIDWSFELLDESQQLLFQRLSVFVGSFTLAAAEAVCADDRLDDLDILDLVCDLVDHSMLIADTSGTATRYRMLESLREYGRQCLGDDAGALEGRHAAYHAVWAGRLFQQLVSADEAAAVLELEDGWADLRTAVVHVSQAGELDLLAAIVTPLAYDAMFRSRLELAEWVTAGLEHPELESAGHDARAALLAIASGLSGLAGDSERSAALGVALCEFCEATGTPVSTQVVGTAVAGAVLAGQLPLGRRIQDLAEQGMPADAPPWAVTTAATFRAIIETYTGHPDVARQASATSVAAAPRDLAPSLAALVGFMAAVHSDAPRADVVLQMEEVVAQASLVRSTSLHGIFSQYLSSVRAELGDLGRPMRDAADNLEAMLATGNLGIAGGTVRRAAVLLIKAQEYAAAATLLGWVDSIQALPPTDDLAAEMAVLIPRMYEELGDPAELAARTSGAELAATDAMQLAVLSLRRAADELDTRA